MKHLTIRTLSEEQLKYAQRNRPHMQNMFSTGRTTPRTTRAVRRDEETPAPEPKTRKPEQPGDSPATTRAKQVAYDKLRDREDKANAWDSQQSGPTPYPKSSKRPGTERGVPTKLSRRRAANMMRAATGQPLLSVDSITPLTLPMIAESNRARRATTKAKKQAILKNLQAKGDKRVDSPTPGKLKFKQREPEVGESGGFYAGQLKDKRDREAARRAEDTWDFSDDRQKEKGFNSRNYQ